MMEEPMEFCPVEEVFAQLLLELNSSRHSVEQKDAIYHQLLLQFYSVIQKHESPAIPLANLKYVSDFLVEFLRSETQLENKVLALLIIVCVLEPITIICDIINNEQNAFQSIKKQCSENYFNTELSKIIIEEITLCQQYFDQKENTNNQVQLRQQELEQLQQQLRIGEEQSQAPEVSETAPVAAHSQTPQPEPLPDQNEGSHSGEAVNAPLETLQSDDEKSADNLALPESECDTPNVVQNSQSVSANQLRTQINKAKSDIADFKSTLLDLQEFRVRVVSEVIVILKLVSRLFQVKFPELGNSNAILINRLKQNQFFDLLQVFLLFVNQEFSELEAGLFELIASMLISNDSKQLQNDVNRVKVRDFMQILKYYDTNQEMPVRLEQEQQPKIKIVLESQDGQTNQSIILNRKTQTQTKTQLGIQKPSVSGQKPIQNVHCIRLARHSSIAPSVLKQLNKDVYQTENNFYQYRSKNVQRVARFNKEIGPVSLNINKQQDGPATIPVDELHLTFLYLQNRSPSTPAQVELADFLFSTSSFWEFITQVTRHFDEIMQKKLEDRGDIINLACCAKYDYGDIKKFGNAIQLQLVALITQVINHIIKQQSYQFCFGIDKDIFSEIVINCFDLQSKLLDDMMSLQGELKSLEYEFKYHRQYFVEFTNQVVLLLKLLQQFDSKLQYEKLMQIKLKASAEDIAKQPDLFYKFDTNEQEQTDVANSCQQQIVELVEIQQKLQQFVNNFYQKLLQSPLLFHIEKLLQKWELIKTKEAVSVREFSLYLHIFQMLKEVSLYFQNKYGIVRVQQQFRRRRVNKQADDVSISGVSGISDDFYDEQDELEFVTADLQYLMKISGSRLFNKLVLVIDRITSSEIIIGPELEILLRDINELFKTVQQNDQNFMEICGQICSIENMMLMQSMFQRDIILGSPVVQKEFADLTFTLKQIVNSFIFLMSNKENMYFVLSSLFITQDISFRKLCEKPNTDLEDRVAKYYQNNENETISRNLMKRKNQVIEVQRETGEDQSEPEQDDKQILRNQNINKYQHLQNMDEDDIPGDEPESRASNNSHFLSQEADDIQAGANFGTKENNLIIKVIFENISEQSISNSLNQLVELLDYIYSALDIEDQLRNILNNSSLITEQTKGLIDEQIASIGVGRLSQLLKIDPSILRKF